MATLRDPAEIDAAARHIATLPPSVLDDTAPWDLPGGLDAWRLYAVRKLLPRPADKLMKVNESSNNYAKSVLGQYFHFIVNVDGHYFGVTEQEDPDDDDEIVYAFESLENPDTEIVYAFESLENPDTGLQQPMSIDLADLFEAIRVFLSVSGEAQ
ncbi:MAG: hypothetical protein GZ088_16020 [Acidipila sp.]|nr:hypothetical protein [Acidipila sp.]